MTDLCEDCGRPRYRGSYTSPEPHCYGPDDTSCVKATVVRLKSQAQRDRAELAELRREAEAWRALAIESSGRAVSLDFSKYSEDSWGAELADYPNTIGKSLPSECVFARPTPQAAAIDLAVKLGLSK